MTTRRSPSCRDSIPWWAIAGGRRSVAVVLQFVGSVWAYDLLLKPTTAGPVAMATARGLDVMLGAGSGAWRRALPAALTVATHTLATTVLSRAEVHGSKDAVVPRLAVAGTAAAATAAASSRSWRPIGWPP